MQSNTFRHVAPSDVPTVTLEVNMYVPRYVCMQPDDD